MRPRSPAGRRSRRSRAESRRPAPRSAAGAGAAARRLHAPEKKTVAAAIVTMTTRGRPAIRINVLTRYGWFIVRCHTHRTEGAGDEVNVPSPPERVDRVTPARLHLCRVRRVGRLGHDIASGGGCHLSDAGAVRPARIVAGRQVRPAEAIGRVTTDVASTDRWTPCAHARGCRLAKGVARRIAGRDAAAAVGVRVLVRRQAGHAIDGDRRRGIGLDASRAAATAAAGRAAGTDRSARAGGAGLAGRARLTVVR